MTIQSSSIKNSEKSYGFHNNYSDVAKMNANSTTNTTNGLINNNSNTSNPKKILGPLSQSKLSYYSNYSNGNGYLNSSQNKHFSNLNNANGKKLNNAQANNFSNILPQSNSKTSNYSTNSRNYYQQQQNVLRNNSNASELKVYDQSDDVDDYYYPQNYVASNKANNYNAKSKLPLPSLSKTNYSTMSNHAQYGKIVLKQQNVNLNTPENIILKKSPLENDSEMRNKKPDDNQMGRKTSESVYNHSNGANASVINSHNGKLLVKKKKTSKPSIFSPDLVSVGNGNEHSNGHSNGYANGHGHTNGNGTEITERQRSTSLLNGVNTTTQKPRVTSSTRLSTNSSNSSSCSSFLNSIEETENLYDMSDLIRKYLNKIEKNYSVEKLYTFVKTNIKHNGYKNLTLENLEAHLAPASNLGNLLISKKSK